MHIVLTDNDREVDLYVILQAWNELPEHIVKKKINKND